MTSDTGVIPIEPSKGQTRSQQPAIKILSWSGTALCLIVITSLFSDYGRINLPDGPNVLFWFCEVAGLAAAILLAPPVFKRSSQLAHACGFVFMLALFIAANIETQQAFDAYMATPAGQQEQAAVNAKAQQEAAVAAAARAKYVASPEYVADQAKAAEQQANDAAEKSKKFDEDLNDCYSTFGHAIPKLTSQVKDSLENPSSFEYKDTTTIGGIDSLYNVEMAFLAQNGFGVTRTASVRAKVKPDDCSIADIDEITD